eukprot:TRINITY_DN12563_c0_g2_i1.p1 TRINITY_DN12563_c0_g2~~TRINITY_DN12563_c0_g2_i1.p1  ORF type:complete len:360 (-),score=41.83 TRINITY_DN12563_c0_g2_i1:12-1091(-)
MADNTWPLLFVGSYTRKEPHVPEGCGVGISVFRVNPETGELHLQSVAPVPDLNPTFLVQVGDTLFAANESGENEATGGAVSAYRIGEDGSLSFQSKQNALGNSSCGLETDGENILVANYSGSSVTVFPIVRQGLAPATGSVAFPPKADLSTSLHPGRQGRSHPHCVTRWGNRFLAADLGRDEVHILRIAPSGELVLDGSVAVPNGTGPRHIKIHPNLPVAYVSGELANVIVVLSLSGETPQVQQVISTLPPGHKDPSWVAEVQVHPSGKFVYVSNRAHESIAWLAVDPTTGLLEWRGFQPCGGKRPRHFIFNPTGTLALVANHDSHNVVAFRVNTETGDLSPTGAVAEVKSATFLHLRS